MQTSAPFDPDATGPRWSQFMQEVFAAHQPLIDFVHRAVGYSLTGRTTEQALFLLLASDIARNGLLTKKGRTRTVFGRWLEVLSVRA